MQSEDAAEPIGWDIAELKRSIEEWEAIAAHILHLLQETVDCAASQNWRPHAGQITAVVSRFRELCRSESRQIECWRQDGGAADETFERVWDEADRVVKWLSRMMQP